MELALFSRAYQTKSLEHTLTKMMQFNIKYIEILGNNNNMHLDFNLLKDRSYKSKVKKMFYDYNVTPCAIALHRDAQLVIGPYGELTKRFFDGTKREQKEFGKRRVLEAAEIASEMEIPIISGYMGCENFSVFYPWPDIGAWKSAADKMIEEWYPIIKRYEELGVSFAHEVALQQIAYDIESSKYISDQINLDSFGFTFDPSNFIFTDVNPNWFVEILGNKILHVHAKDAEKTIHAPISGNLSHTNFNSEKRGVRFRIPGWGDLDWKKVLTSLKVNGYNGMISIEIEDKTMETDEAVEKSVSFLNNILYK